MSAAKHTPAPWAVETEPYFHVRAKDGSQGGWGSTVFAGDCASHADCWLIAAAPDGYDASNLALFCLEVMKAQLATFGVTPACNADGAIEKLKAYFSKARGDAPGVVQS